MINPRDAGYGGKLDPDPPRPGARFRALGQGTATVAALITVVDDEWHRPVSFLVRAEDGTFWALVSADPILDGIAYTGTKMQNT